MKSFIMLVIILSWLININLDSFEKLNNLIKHNKKNSRH